MDWDLWGPPDFQASPERDCQLQPGGQFDYYFGHGTDVLEETALNEKCCAQVLRILIKNADNEIDELEESLVVLQSQLAWAEYEEWSEICGTALQEKIKYLSISISSLRNEKDHDSNVQLQLHRGPAEKIHEIFKALLKNFSQERDPQHFVKESSSHTLGCATDCSDESKKLSGSDSNIIVKEEMELASSSAGKCTAGNSSLTPETERKKIDSPKKTPDVIIRSSNNASKHVTGCRDGKEKAYDSNFISTRDEVNALHSTPTTKSIGLAPSLEHGEEKEDLEGKIKPFIKESSSHTLGCATECLDEREKLSESESNIFVEEEMLELATTLAGKCTAPNSSLTSQGKKTNSPKKTPDVIIRSSNNASKDVTGCTDGKKKAYDSNFRNTRDEVNEHRSTPTTKNTILAPSLDPGEEKTDLEVKVKVLAALFSALLRQKIYNLYGEIVAMIMLQKGPQNLGKKIYTAMNEISSPIYSTRSFVRASNIFHRLFA